MTDAEKAELIKFLKENLYIRLNANTKHDWYSKVWTELEVTVIIGDEEICSNTVSLGD